MLRRDRNGRRGDGETRTAALLRERERRGLQALTTVRCVFVLVVLFSTLFARSDVFEIAATALVVAPALLILGVSFFFLAKGRAVTAVGLVGCGIDIAFLAVMPIIWYVADGGALLPASYILKTQITIFAYAVVALNALAFRPLFPLVVAAGAVVIHAVFIMFVFFDSRVEISSDFVTWFMGPTINVPMLRVRLVRLCVLGLAMAYLTHAVRRAVQQAVTLEVANTQFRRYFSPGVVSRIQDDADRLLGVGGSAQSVAILFCDIRGFTAITEKLTPSETLQFLTEYQSHTVDAVFRYEGTIDKFMGAATMATFGTPETHPDDAERAVRAAIAMNAAVAQFNANREAMGLEPIHQEIGIHFGEIVAGNIGTEDRLEYTVVGDSVNVASRIQEACKSLGESIVISAQVARRLPPDIALRALPAQKLRGRHAPVELYAVDGNAVGGKTGLS